MTSTEIRIDHVARIARESGYCADAFEAALMYTRRRDRIDNPPGSFDKAGRFTAAERTEAVESVRAPSRAHPYPEMTAARSAKHCAEVMEVDPLHVKRIARALDLVEKPVDSAHEAVAKRHELQRIIKIVGAPVAA